MKRLLLFVYQNSLRLSLTRSWRGEGTPANIYKMRRGIQMLKDRRGTREFAIAKTGPASASVGTGYVIDSIIRRQRQKVVSTRAITAVPFSVGGSCLGLVKRRLGDSDGTRPVLRRHEKLLYILCHRLMR